MNPTVQTDDARFLELLERWMQGEFTRADEHALEALAATDDFRREALEGFWSDPEGNHQALLATLRKRIPVHGPARRVALVPRMWAAAAALVLLLAAVWVFYNNPLKNERGNIAQSAPETAPSVPDKAAETAPPPAAVQEPLAAQKEAFRGKMRKGEPAGPQPDANDQDAPGQIASGARAADSFSAGQGIATEKKAEQEPADMVMTAPAKSAEAQAERPEENAKMRKAAPSGRARQVTSPTPVGGWENFQETLYRQARLTEPARQANVSGVVLLRLTIGADSTVRAVRVVKSLGFGLDQEAERLVRRFKWAPGQDREVEVSVPFVR